MTRQSDRPTPSKPVLRPNRVAPVAEFGTRMQRVMSYALAINYHSRKLVGEYLMAHATERNGLSFTEVMSAPSDSASSLSAFELNLREMLKNMDAANQAMGVLVDMDFANRDKPRRGRPVAPLNSALTVIVRVHDQLAAAIRAEALVQRMNRAEIARLAGLPTPKSLLTSRAKHINGRASLVAGNGRGSLFAIASSHSLFATPGVSDRLQRVEAVARLYI